jgi:uncharacterized protein YdcH (DUF465 family)
MQIESHSLVHDFPELKERIHHLKMGDRHFARLFEEYDQLDKEIHRIEQDFTTSDDYLEGLKVRRVHLKDELYRLLQVAE